MNADEARALVARTAKDREFRLLKTALEHIEKAAKEGKTCNHFTKDFEPIISALEGEGFTVEPVRDVYKVSWEPLEDGPPLPEAKIVNKRWWQVWK